MIFCVWSNFADRLLFELTNFEMQCAEISWAAFFVRLIDDAFGIVWLWRTKLQVASVKLTKSIPHGDPHLVESQAGSGWWPWPVPRRSPRPRGSCRGGTPRREGRTAGRWSRSKAWCTSRCQQGDPSRPQLAWFLPWKPMHPAQQGQPLPSRGSAWAEWRQATPSASTAPTPRHPGTRSARCVVHGEPFFPDRRLESQLSSTCGKNFEQCATGG